MAQAQEKKFNVEGVGVVTLNNAIWQRCYNKSVVLRLQIGECARATFGKGNRTDTVRVERIA